MKALLRRFKDRYGKSTSLNRDIHMEWEAMRQRLVSPYDHAQIDATFARHY